MEEFTHQVEEKMGPFSEFYQASLVRRSALDPLTTINSDEKLRSLSDYSELDVIVFFY